MNHYTQTRDFSGIWIAIFNITRRERISHFLGGGSEMTEQEEIESSGFGASLPRYRWEGRVID